MSQERIQFGNVDITFSIGEYKKAIKVLNPIRGLYDLAADHIVVS